VLMLMVSLAEPPGDLHTMMRQHVGITSCNQSMFGGEALIRHRSVEL